MKDGGDHVYVGNPNRSGGIANLPGTVNIDMGRNFNPDEFVNEQLTLRVENHQTVNINLGTGSDWQGQRA